MIAKSDKAEASVGVGQTRQINVRVPEHVYQHLLREGGPRGEDVTMVTRRHLLAGVSHSLRDKRFDALELKMDAILSFMSTDRTQAIESRLHSMAATTEGLLQDMSQAALDMEARLTEVVVNLKTLRGEMHALKEAHLEIVDTLNAYIDPEGENAD